MKAWSLLVSLVILCASGSVAALPQEAGAVEILEFSWTKERIRDRPSHLPLASSEELIRQSQMNAQIAAARNSANKAAAGRIETQAINHEEAKNKARQTAPPEDGYRYKVKLRNNGAKTIKSIDWDYVFIDPTNQSEVARHQFASDETVKPGKSKEVSVLYLIPPIKTVSAKLLGGKKTLPYEQRVELVRIQYSDGSVWQKP